MADDCGHSRRASALVVDDEAPARDELTYLLRTFPNVGWSMRWAARATR